MKKIVPFKKDIIFKTDLTEVTNIALEHTLKQTEERVITGDFLVNGEYKINEESESLETFSYSLPFEINLDEKYDAKEATIDIDDFYYEIVNNKVLSISIDVALDNLEEKEVEEIPEEEPRCIDEEEIKGITTEEDIYQSYKVYIVREEDTIEGIMEKYSVTKESLEEYNDLSSFGLNSKIIIPYNETNS